MNQAAEATPARVDAAERRTQADGTASNATVAGAALRALAANAVLLGLAGAYAATYWALHPGTPSPDPAVLRQTATVFGIFLLLGLPLRVLAAAVAAARRGNTSPATQRWRAALRDHAGAGAVLSAVMAWAAVSVLYTVYLQWKAEIGVAFPFSWDVRLAELDRVLHLGGDPWRLFESVYTRPRVVHATDFIYHKVWGLVILALPGVMAWSRNAESRTRFFLVFALAWITAGTAGAYLMPSAGPVFFAGVTDGDLRFAPLVEQLRAVHATHPLTAVAAADFLWSGYRLEAWPRVGISAMPSMHIAIAAVAMLLVWPRGGVVRVLGVAFLAIMLVGSVLLGWHYAVDGYASIAIVLLLWWCVGEVQRVRAARRP